MTIKSATRGFFSIDGLRACLGAALVGVSVGASPVSVHAEDAGQRFRAIEIDVGPLRGTGDVYSASVIAQELPGSLREALGAHLAPNDRSAPILRARIDSVSFGTPGSSGTLLNSTHDWIEGVGEVIGPLGNTVAIYPLTVSNGVDPNLSDVTGTDGRNRIVMLARSFARWLPGKVGL